MTYERTAGQKQGDFHEARAFEEHVASFIPFKVTRFNAADELDIWIPGAYVEVKEKRQKLTDRWHLLEGVDERDLFVMDELSLRRCLRHAPYSYLLISDVPEDRYFILNALEMAVAERARVNRAGKGKAIFNLQDFRRLASLEQLSEFVMSDLVATPWKQSQCWSIKEIKEV